MNSKITTTISVIILIIMICYLVKQAMNLTNNVKPYNYYKEGFTSRASKKRHRGIEIRRNDRLTENEDFSQRHDKAEILADKLDDLYEELEHNYKSMKSRKTNISQVTIEIIRLKKKIRKIKLKIKTVYPNYNFEDFELREKNIYRKYIHPYMDEDDNVICYNQDKDTCVNKKGCKWNSNYRECEKDANSDSDSDAFWDLKNPLY